MDEGSDREAGWEGGKEGGEDKVYEWQTLFGSGFAIHQGLLAPLQGGGEDGGRTQRYESGEREVKCFGCKEKATESYSKGGCNDGQRKADCAEWDAD